MAALDYSKWDHIDESEEEDEVRGATALSFPIELLNCMGRML